MFLHLALNTLHPTSNTLTLARTLHFTLFTLVYALHTLHSAHIYIYLHIFRRRLRVQRTGISLRELGAGLDIQPIEAAKWHQLTHPRGSHVHMRVASQDQQDSEEQENTSETAESRRNSS